MGFFDQVAAAWSPQNIGDSIEGEILKTFERQQTGGDIVNGKFIPNQQPRFFKNGQPAMALVVVLKIAEETEEDNGQRTVYVNRPSRMFKAVVKALKDVGAREIEEGGRLRVEYTGLDPESANGKAKMYKASYAKPGESPVAATALPLNPPVTSSAQLDEAAELMRRLEELKAQQG